MRARYLKGVPWIARGKSRNCEWRRDEGLWHVRVSARVRLHRVVLLDELVNYKVDGTAGSGRKQRKQRRRRSHGTEPRRWLFFISISPTCDIRTRVKRMFASWQDSTYMYFRWRGTLCLHYTWRGKLHMICPITLHYTWSVTLQCIGLTCIISPAS